jgi:hypothetical protein
VIRRQHSASGLIGSPTGLHGGGSWRDMASAASVTRSLPGYIDDTVSNGAKTRAAAVASCLAPAIIAAWIIYDRLFLPKSDGADIGVGIAGLVLLPAGLAVGITALLAQERDRLSGVAWVGVLLSGGFIVLAVLGTAGAFD